MKKLIVFLIGGIVALNIAACSNNDSEKKSDREDQSHWRKGEFKKSDDKKY